MESECSVKSNGIPASRNILGTRVISYRKWNGTAYRKEEAQHALSAWINQEEERSRLTREALADVDAGRAIAHQAAQAWANSLDSDQPLPLPPIFP
jgi:predicted transcriptional regulator